PPRLPPPAHPPPPRPPPPWAPPFARTGPPPLPPPPRCLRSQKTPRQTDRSADRPHSPVPHTPGRPSRNGRPPSASQQSHQTPARCRSTSPPNRRRAQPETSIPTTVPYRLPCTASFTSSVLPLEYRQFFCGASPLSA